MEYTAVVRRRLFLVPVVQHILLSGDNVETVTMVDFFCLGLTIEHQQRKRQSTTPRHPRRPPASTFFLIRHSHQLCAFVGCLRQPKAAPVPVPPFPCGSQPSASTVHHTQYVPYRREKERKTREARSFLFLLRFPLLPFRATVRAGPQNRLHKKGLLVLLILPYARKQGKKLAENTLHALQ